MRLSVFIIILTLVSGLSSAGQLLSPSHPVYEGMVMSDSSKTPLAYVHIYNESKRTGNISDAQGQFKFRANAGDTLVFSSIGFLGQVVIVTDSMIEKGSSVFLIPRNYTIDAVNIVGLGSYEDFKRKFLALEISKTEAIQLREKLKAIARVEAQQALLEEEARNSHNPQPGSQPINGIPILYKADLQRINYQRVLNMEAKQRVVNKKYNREIIAKVTGLPEDEIIDFMSFCNFTMEDLYHMTDYDIVVLIEKKYKEYLEKKNQSGASYNLDIVLLKLC